MTWCDFPNVGEHDIYNCNSCTLQYFYSRCLSLFTYMLVCTVDMKYYVTASFFITRSNPHLPVPPLSKHGRDVLRHLSPPLSLSSFSVVILSTTSSSREEIRMAFRQAVGLVKPRVTYLVLPSLSLAQPTPLLSIVYRLEQLSWNSLRCSANAIRGARS